MIKKEPSAGKKRFVFYLLSCLLLMVLIEPSVSTAGLISREIEPGVYLLSVGIGNYNGIAEILPFAKNDAISFTKTIEENSKLKISKKILLSGSAATKEEIINSLDSIAREIGSDDTFIFHFAGNGSAINADRFDLYTDGYDLRKTGDELKKENEEKSISQDLLKSYFARIRAKTKILVFDTGISSFVCQQGDSFFSQSGGNSLFIGTKSTSFDVAKRKQGAVTGLLLDALKGESDSNYDGVVNAWEVLAFLGNARNNKNLTGGERNLEFCTSTQGGNFDIVYTDKKAQELKIEAEKIKRRTEKDKTQTAPANRSDVIEQDVPENKPQKRVGDDYALLFAFDEYEAGWTKLRNPKNDIREVGLELKNRYKFKEVVSKENLTLEEFEKVIEEYKQRTFTDDDQLFIFFAGHGVVDKAPPNNGYLVVKDSFSPDIFNKRKTDTFIKLDQLLGDVSAIKNKHIMVVFDACFAGQIWHPSVTLVKSELVNNFFPAQKNRASEFSSGLPVFGFQPEQNLSGKFPFRQDENKLTRDELINRELANYSRIVLTSGHDIVSDGKPGANSPFATQFLEALKTGAEKDGLLTLPEIMGYVKFTRNKTPAELGRIDKQGEKATGGFIFCQGGCTTEPEQSGPRGKR